MNIEPRQYQQAAVDWLCKRRRGLIVSPAGSGKTIIAAGAIARVLSAKPRTSKVKVGWICNTIEQKRQAHDALDLFPPIAEMAETRIECAQADADWRDRDVLIVDECHHIPAKSWFDQVEKFTGALWGFTATPWSETEDERNSVLSGLFDGQIYAISRDAVADNIAPAKVVMVEATDPGLREKINAEIERLEANWKRLPQRFRQCSEWDFHARTAFRVCVELGIVGNKLRTEQVLLLAISHAADSVLVLVNQVEHGKEIAAGIPGARMCFSAMGDKARREAIADFKSGVCRCLVATSLADEGLDVPIANVLILVSAGRSKTRTEQRTGRVLRRHAAKSGATIYDFMDSGVHPLLCNQAMKRMRIYRDLGYKIEL